MAEWVQRFTQSIYREYDRRIRRASQITTYAAQPHAQAEAAAEEGAIEITNIPRGTTIGTSMPGSNYHGDSAES